MITAPVMTVSGAPSARVARPWPIDSRSTLPPPNTASSPARPGPAAAVLGDLDEQVGVGQPDPVAGGRSEQCGVAGAGSSVMTRPSCPGGVEAQPVHLARPAQRNQRDMLGDTGFEPHRGACRNVEPVAVGGGAVEVQRRVGLRQMHMAADLHRPVAGVDESMAQPRRARVDGDVAFAVDNLAGDQTPRPSRDRVVDGDELGAVRERGLDLDVVEHLGDALHDVVAGENLAAADHQLGHRAAVAGTLEEVVGDHRDGLGMVELQAARLSASRQFGGIGQQQPVLFMRGQEHSRRYCHGHARVSSARNMLLLRGDVLQPHLAARDDPIVVVGDGDQPQLLATAAMNRCRRRGDRAGPGSDGLGNRCCCSRRRRGAAAVGWDSQTCPGDAGHALDDRAVDAAVHDSPWLQQLVGDLQLGPVRRRG